MIMANAAVGAQPASLASHRAGSAGICTSYSPPTRSGGRSSPSRHLRGARDFSAPTTVVCQVEETCLNDLYSDAASKAAARSGCTPGEIRVTEEE